jgi:hypothetical protein
VVLILSRRHFVDFQGQKGLGNFRLFEDNEKPGNMLASYRLRGGISRPGKMQDLHCTPSSPQLDDGRDGNGAPGNRIQIASDTEHPTSYSREKRLPQSLSCRSGGFFIDIDRS